MNRTVYIYRWGKYLPELKGRRCWVLARGKLNSAMVEWCDGKGEPWCIVSRNALRKAPDQTMENVSNEKKN
jgi:hypothetical protein